MFKKGLCNGDIGTEIQRLRMNQPKKESGQVPEYGMDMTTKSQYDKNKTQKESEDRWSLGGKQGNSCRANKPHQWICLLQIQWEVINVVLEGEWWLCSEWFAQSQIRESGVQWGGYCSGPGGR